MEEKKKWIRTPAANQAQYRYNAKNIKRIPLDVQITEYEQIKAAAAEADETINGYIKTAIRERMAAGHTETDAGPAEITQEAKTERTPIKL